MSKQIIEQGKRLQEEAVQVQQEYVDFVTPYLNERNKRFKDMKYAWNKKGQLFEDRNDFLRNLPEDKDGCCIIHSDDEAKNTFHELESEFSWDMEFMEYAVAEGLACAWDFDEYYSITD